MIEVGFKVVSSVRTRGEHAILDEDMQFLAVLRSTLIFYMYI